MNQHGLPRAPMAAASTAGHKQRFSRAPLVAALAVLALLIVPAAAQAHTSSADVTCTQTVIHFTFFHPSGTHNGGLNEPHYVVTRNGATVVDAQASFSDDDDDVTVPLQLFNGDVVKVETYWAETETRDRHSQPLTTIKTYTASQCGERPPQTCENTPSLCPPPPTCANTPSLCPPAPVYDCQGNVLPPGTTPPTCPPPTSSTPATVTPVVPASGTLPETVLSGRARLNGPSGCVKRAFRATVRGRSIASVVFFVDGKLVKRYSRGGNSFSIKVKPRGLGFGRHRIVARVRFDADSGTRARRIPLTFQRCARQVVQPRFTG